MKPITTLVTKVLTNYHIGSKDEYTREAETITAFIINNRCKITEDLLADNIQFVFIRYDNTLIDYSKCIIAARDIMKQI